MWRHHPLTATNDTDWRALLGRGASVHISRAEAEPLLRRALELARARGVADGDMAGLLHHLGDACRGTGKLDEAEAFLTEAAELAQRATPDAAWATWSGLATVKTLRGNPDGAAAIYERLAREEARTASGSPVWTLAHATALLAAGAPERAERVLEQARELLGDGGHNPTMRAEQLAQMGLAFERLGKLERALALVREAETLLADVAAGRRMSPSARLPGDVLAPVRAHRERIEATLAARRAGG